MTRELRQLTGARGVAAWAVVLYHLRRSIDGLPDWLAGVFAKGYLAVDFFFLLSGFVIWLAWHQRIPGGTRRFWQKRVARIFPLHLAMLGFAVALALLSTVRGRPDPAFPWSQLPLHVLLLQEWGVTAGLHWNDPAWSISAELAAYILFPLLIIAVDWRRWSTPALIATAPAVLLALHLGMAAPTLGTDIPRLGLVRCLAEFTTGTIVGALYLRGGGARTFLLVALTLLATWFAGAPETLAVPAAFACLLLALARHDASPLAAKPFHWLGEISYATYLLHFLLWKAVKLLLLTPLAPWWVAGLYCIALLLGSHLLYRRVELPAQRWVNGLGRNEARTRALPGDAQNRLVG